MLPTLIGLVEMMSENAENIAQREVPYWRAMVS